MPKSFWKRCVGTPSLQYLGHPFFTESERYTLYVCFASCLTCFWCQNAWFYNAWFYILMSFNHCIPLWKNIKAVNFSPTSFHPHNLPVPQTKTGTEGSSNGTFLNGRLVTPRPTSPKSPTCPTRLSTLNLLGDDWWMWLARGVGYSALCVCFFCWWLKVFGKKLLSNFNDSFVCTTQFEYAFGH